MNSNFWSALAESVMALVIVFGLPSTLISWVNKSVAKQAKILKDDITDIDSRLRSHVGDDKIDLADIRADVAASKILTAVNTSQIEDLKNMLGEIRSDVKELLSRKT